MPKQHSATQVLDAILLVAPSVFGALASSRTRRRLDRAPNLRERGDDPLDPSLLLASDTRHHLLAETHRALREPPCPRAFDGLELLLRLSQPVVDGSLDLADLATGR